MFCGSYGQGGQCHFVSDLRSGRRLPLPVLANLHLDGRNPHHRHGEANPVPIHHVWATKLHQDVKDRKAARSDGSSCYTDMQYMSGSSCTRPDVVCRRQLECSDSEKVGNNLKAAQRTRLNYRFDDKLQLVCSLTLVAPGGWSAVTTFKTISHTVCGPVFYFVRYTVCKCDTMYLRTWLSAFAVKHFGGMLICFLFHCV